MRASVPTEGLAEPPVATIGASAGFGSTPSGAFAESQNSLRNLVLILVGIALALGWANRLHWGLWTDEAGTYWMSSQGWRAAIARTSTFSGQSLLYSILESFFIAGGFWLEPLLRFPSVVATLVAAWQMKKLAEVTLGRDAGWIAVLALMCAPEIVSYATSARPYALALAASLASFRYLLEWQKTERTSLAVRYLAAAVLTLYFHYLFAFVFVVQGLYLAFCWWRKKAVRLWLPAAAVVILPLSLLPLTKSLLATASTKGYFAGATKPQVLQLLEWCFPPVFLVALALGAVLLLLSARNLRWRPKPAEAELVFLVFNWLLVAPVAFFVVSRFTENSIFGSRYMLFTVPAFVLILTWGVCGLARTAWRKTVLVAIFAGTILHPGMLVYVFHPAANSWREPLQFIAGESQKDPAPVFITSGLAHSDGMDWQHADPRTDSLYSPLTVYPTPNKPLPLPYRFSRDAQDFIRTTMAGDLATANHLFLLASGDSQIGAWTSSYLKGLGFAATTTEFGDYVVVDYQRPAKR